ncbi:MAG: hypothetical protein Ct9H300mP26_1850 [Acidimicrobiales bacterium]|nr:MAG: hypothetical protein Ct9H300mP26_1850 [Acidimicrobiales bacterium]
MTTRALSWWLLLRISTASSGDHVPPLTAPSEIRCRQMTRTDRLLPERARWLVQRRFHSFTSCLMPSELPDPSGHKSSQQKQREKVRRYPFRFTNEAVHQVHASWQRRLSRRVPPLHPCGNRRCMFRFPRRVRRARSGESYLCCPRNHDDWRTRTRRTGGCLRDK